MKTKTLVALALLAAIGTVLHAVVPNFIFGMKPDLSLIMMFIGILLFPERKNVLLIGVVTGFISALTTGFPGGQIPNIIDKPLTAFAFYFLYLALKNFDKPLVRAGILTAVGTIISGTVFLTSALLIVGLPGGASFTFFFLTVVLPACAMNTVLMVVIYPIITSIAKRSNLSVAL
ncbi:tryptophan transporter [Sutcliffiella cohnii]|uniref:Tryptophan transporter n=1 Tax=Sutcliffiella cohnii TaxID=33932 RepID=A0A223KLY7_9BACI|nr:MULTISPECIES: tryptophan transporter [Sutcliffiella]AST90491.1 tryptophan transporter [Sutcliffiella cohnii]MED4017390.1 tryptophan transporter [Sutcliffiella cohnii]WBL16143.1 tryptophan transporter [Sutcliffiella sp. NC1]